MSQVVARIFVSRRVTCHSTGRFQAVAWVLYVILIFLYARATGAVAGAVPADKFAAESGGAADDGGRARARHRGAAHRGQGEQHHRLWLANAAQARPAPSTPPPRPLHALHGACSWESWAFATLVTSVLNVCAPHVRYNTPWEFRLKETLMP